MAEATALIAAEACAELAAGIADAGGNEVFFVGEPGADGRVAAVTAHAWGNQAAVNAFLERAKPGQVLIHNHPSGELFPSAPDLDIAGRAGAMGFGFYIVDNAAGQVYPVVRPWQAGEPTAVDHDWIDDVLGADGVLARKFPGFEVRPGQVELAHRAAERFNSGGIALLEAGTGIGKSFAYLLPSLRTATDNGSAVVVSTASIALQEQLFEKDVPALSRLLDQPIRAVVLKGRSNYVSIRRARQFLGGSATLVGPGIPKADRDRFAQWLETTTSGDRSTVPAGLSPELWDEVQSESDNCLRSRCHHFGECHYFQSRREASAAQLVIVNHALLCADLVVRDAAQIPFREAALLPPYHQLVVDEAHALEGYARGGFGARVSEQAIARTLLQLRRRKGKGGAIKRLRDRLTDMVDRMGRDVVMAIQERLDAADDAIPAAEKTASLWFANVGEWLAGRRGDDPVRTPVDSVAFAALAEDGQRAAAALDDVADRVLGAVEPDQLAELPPGLYGIWSEATSRARRLQSHATAMRAVLTNQSRREVSWIERRGRRGRPAMEIAPVDVGALLQERLWERIGTAVLTSATLATGPEDFRFVSRGLGLEEPAPERAQIPSPFPYPELVLLGLVQGLDVGRSGDWGGSLAAAVGRLVAASEGRALVLCTSFKAVRGLSAALRRDPALAGIPILAQGEAPARQLGQRFRNETASVLVGTNTFWEGFDAVGETLRQVIITKLPFRVPTHPLEVARHEWVKAQGGDGFKDLSLPEAVMRFRQGFGRLVRTARDWGAVTVLDERVQRRGYGRRFLASLPETAQVQGPVDRVAEQVGQWCRARQGSSP